MSVVEELRSTFTSITKDVTGVLTVVVTMGILIIILPVLIQLNQLIQRLSGAGVAPTAATTTQALGIQQQTGAAIRDRKITVRYV